MKNYAILLLVPAAVAGAWYVGGHAVIAPDQALADVPKYGLDDLPSVSTEKIRRPPVSFATFAFGTKREQPVAPPPVVVAQVPRVVPVLQAVMIDGDHRVAHIDGIVLREGAVIGGVRLSRIEAKRVLVVSLDGGRKTWLSLDGEN